MCVCVRLFAHSRCSLALSLIVVLSLSLSLLYSSPPRHRYVGQVDFAKNRRFDHNDDIMGLLHTNKEETSLVVVPAEAGNIARFINGINNHDPERSRKQNVRSARFAIEGKVRVILFACKDIPRGAQLLYDYNGRDPQGYPTSHFL